MKKYLAGGLALLVVSLTACGDSGGDKPDATKQARQSIERHAKGRAPYLPKHDVEFKNYNAAQKLYDSPETIIWCSTTWGNASAPLVTVPVTGKLTSSSTTFFQPDAPLIADVPGDGYGAYAIGGTTSSRSVDGLYHPNPPQYRYGFTPGGQYVDFFNMPTFCTTALTKFQRQSTKVTVAFDPGAQQAQRNAEAALKRGDKQAAQHALEAIGG